MNLLKQPMVIIVMIAVVAIVAVYIGESYKVAWMSDWLAPILMLLFFIGLSTLSTVPPRTVNTQRGKVAWFARTAAFAGLIWLFISIDLVGDAPVAMRLMGMSWTMSPHAAARFLELAGLIIGAIGVGLSWMDARREAAAAARDTIS